MLNADLIATAFAFTDTDFVTERVFHFFSDGTILYLEGGEIEYHPWTSPLPFMLDFLEIRDQKTFDEMFSNWND